MTTTSDLDRISHQRLEVERLLARHRLIENLVSRQEMPNHRLVDSVVQKQNLSELGALLARLDTPDVARVLESLSREDRLRAWRQVDASRSEAILLLLMDNVREELIESTTDGGSTTGVRGFAIDAGRLREVAPTPEGDASGARLVWVDLLAPTAQERLRIGRWFGVDLPAPGPMTDLETSSRFYVEPDGAMCLNSNFLLAGRDGPTTVPVLFVVHHGVLFSVRPQALPMFRLQQLRAAAQPDYVADALDILLDLYASDMECSADALEGIYGQLDSVGDAVLQTQMSDSVAAQALVDIARAEDLNGRVRRSVLDTRRAISFLLRGKALADPQREQAREIMRDIESIDGHTTFVFGKINFLMDATVGFVNISQNKRVSQLTSIGIIFMPINIIAGIGGMSEFSMITHDLGLGWPLAYGLFVAGAVLAGWTTHTLLGRLEARQARRATRANVRVQG